MSGGDFSYQAEMNEVLKQRVAELTDETKRLRLASAVMSSVLAVQQAAVELAKEHAEEGGRLMAELIASSARLPQPHEKYVVVAKELVAELQAAPSRPVTVSIVETDGGRLEMTFTAYEHESPAGGSNA